MVLGDIVVEQQASIIAYLIIGRMKILLCPSLSHTVLVTRKLNSPPVTGVGLN